MLATRRLALERLTTDDAVFLRELFNDPAFLRYVGDKGIRTLEDARTYVLEGPVASYERFGFGLYRVELAKTGVPIGICGLLKREFLPDPDIGFAFLPDFRRRGYATEAATAVMLHARNTLGLERILAITAPGNEASERILRKIGLELEGMIRAADDEPEICLFATRPQ